ncbi:hypothetical protein DMENIID0001_014260 [Sergentomyia squamirostris]
MKILVVLVTFVVISMGDLGNDLVNEYEGINGTSVEIPVARARRPSEKNCICTQTQCECCAGLKLPRLKVDRQICTKLNYNRHTSLLRMGVVMNGKEVAQNTIYVRQTDGSAGGGQGGGGEGSNPTPFCLPIPIPFFNIDLCVKLFDLSTPGPNLHMCMDWLARIASVPIIVLHFDCMQIGLDGVNFMKPGETIDGPSGVNPVSPIDPSGPIIDSPGGIGGGGIGGGGGGFPVFPVSPVSPVAPAQPSPPDTGIITSPSGPNLPQVGGDGSDFDPVDDIKNKPGRI